MKNITQPIMIWFIPLILIAGLFFPYLGYLVLLMMVFFLILSYFKGRLWCSSLCPRGALLDLLISRISLKRKIPKIFYLSKVRWLIFFIFVAFFILQFVLAPKNLNAIGFVFVRMCIITTLLSILIGVPLHHRFWCLICPMGTLQSKIRSFNKG